MLVAMIMNVPALTSSCDSHMTWEQEKKPCNFPHIEVHSKVWKWREVCEAVWSGHCQTLFVWYRAVSEPNHWHKQPDIRFYFSLICVSASTHQTRLDYRDSSFLRDTKLAGQTGTDNQWLAELARGNCSYCGSAECCIVLVSLFKLLESLTVSQGTVDDGRRPPASPSSTNGFQ